MNTDKRRSGIADDGIERRALTIFPAHLGVPGVKKSNAEDAEEGGCAARGRRDEFPSVSIRVHPCSMVAVHRSTPMMFRFERR